MRLPHAALLLAAFATFAALAACQAAHAPSRSSHQAFGEATQIGGGAERQDVRINDSPVVLLREPASGELLLQWMVGRDGVAFVANEADMTLEELLEIAEAIRPD